MHVEQELHFDLEEALFMHVVCDQCVMRSLQWPSAEPRVVIAWQLQHSSSKCTRDAVAYMIMLLLGLFCLSVIALGCCRSASCR